MFSGNGVDCVRVMRKMLCGNGLDGLWVIKEMCANGVDGVWVIKEMLCGNGVDGV